MLAGKSVKSEILAGIIRSDCQGVTRSRNSRSSKRSNSNSMTNPNSLRLRLLLWSNIFGLLLSRSQALPFEYLDEPNDDFNYDLDTAQSQAKYDAHLLSQQMLSDAELLQQTAGTGSATHTLRAQSSGLATGSVEDLEPHSRAAACNSNGHTYTHGQKVPREDACEVCLCMDGEIFCWWERCDRENANKVKEATAAASSDNEKGKGAGKGAGFAVGVGFDGGVVPAVGDYSDPYRHESTTRKSTKVHKMAGKVGKRRKHRARNQKNFNDYEVYESHKQQPKDYKKSGIKQEEEQQQQQQLQKQKTGAASNYNIIKQHKHEQQQQQKLAKKQLQQEEEQQQQQQQQEQQQQEEPQKQDQGQQHAHNLVALSVNQAAAKDMHYPQPATTDTPTQQQPPEHPHHTHPHRPPTHSSSKILNFPENLPALLYYDYKTEEHEHHQHQHHQQHLLHEKQRLQHQQEALARQKSAGAGAGTETETTAVAGVELHTDLGVDKNFDEAETDSDILPEPPTKRPKEAAPPATADTQWTTSSSSSSSSSPSPTTKALMTSTTATTPTTTATTRTNGWATSRLSKDPAAATNPGRNAGQDLDDAFHRWLTSTELNADSTNTPDDASEQETAASTIIDDVAIRNKSDSANRAASRGSGNSKDNARNNNVADAVFFRSSYNDYSSEFNGSVVNIDITLTAVDVHPRQQQQQQQQPQQQQTDLIANGNSTAVAMPETTAGTTTTTMDPQANDKRSSVAISRDTPTSSSRTNSQDQHQASGSSRSPVVPPYTLTTIITTTPPLSPGRMCNVLGKLYKIGDILPQDTGNCLQCICTDAVTPDEMPSVTCSPHNCPPLVLPDLFDATGY
ncbi:ras guanine nucleotide exchange factor R [Drosophila subobscura]|uniref:ras guanine nucleotide exchange factor R n=1 Tax=Drosophila subobscura TaxID=7241 RepID=UPI00155ABE4B|nr:ras guanine nucleotide exchange factor R [Drosophila subobscura]